MVSHSERWYKWGGAWRLVGGRLPRNGAMRKLKGWVVTLKGCPARPPATFWPDCSSSLPASDASKINESRFGTADSLSAIRGGCVTFSGERAGLLVRLIRRPGGRTNACTRGIYAFASFYLWFAHLPHNHVKAEDVRCPGCLSVAVDLWRHPEVGPHLLRRVHSRRVHGSQSASRQQRARSSIYDMRYTHVSELSLFCVD